MSFKILYRSTCDLLSLRACFKLMTISHFNRLIIIPTTYKISFRLWQCLKLSTVAFQRKVQQELIITKYVKKQNFKCKLINWSKDATALKTLSFVLVVVECFISEDLRAFISNSKALREYLRLELKFVLFDSSYCYSK